MQPDQPSNQQPLMPPIPGSAAQPTDNQRANIPAAPAPELADDGDLIEKEWVQQAKQIVSKTADDPYQQSIQFTQLKAQYLKKRYGKQLKTDS